MSEHIPPSSPSFGEEIVSRRSVTKAGFHLFLVGVAGGLLASCAENTPAIPGVPVENYSFDLADYYDTLHTNVIMEGPGSVLHSGPAEATNQLQVHEKREVPIYTERAADQTDNHAAFSGHRVVGATRVTGTDHYLDAVWYDAFGGTTGGEVPTPGTVTAPSLIQSYTAAVEFYIRDDQPIQLNHEQVSPQTALQFLAENAAPIITEGEAYPTTANATPSETEKYGTTFLVTKIQQTTLPRNPYPVATPTPTPPPGSTNV